MTPSMLVLAESTTDSLQHLGLQVIGLLIAFGVLGAVATTFIRGVWTKTGEPTIRKAFDSFRTEGPYVDAEKKRIRDIVEAVNNEQGMLEAEKKRVREIIENEAKRVDGLIRQEISTQFMSFKTEVIEAINALKKALDDDKRQVREDLGEFREETVGRLGKIEGALLYMSQNTTQTNKPQKT